MKTATVCCAREHTRRTAHTRKRADSREFALRELSVRYCYFCDQALSIPSLLLAPLELAVARGALCFLLTPETMDLGASDFVLGRILGKIRKN